MKSVRIGFIVIFYGLTTDFKVNGTLSSRISARPKWSVSVTHVMTSLTIGECLSMTDYASLPPSHKTPEPDGFFQGGMMPATGPDLTALIILDLRNLGLSSIQGRELEAEIREFVHQRLEKMDVNLKNRSAIDLSKSVFGISFD